MAMSWKHARLGSQQKWIAELLQGLKTYAYLALFVYLPVCLSVCLSIYLSVCLPVVTFDWGLELKRKNMSHKLQRRVRRA